MKLFIKILIICMVTTCYAEEYTSQVNNGKPPIEVKTFKVLPRTVPDLAYSIGMIQPIWAMTVSSEVDGKVTQILVKPNQLIAKNATIIQLDNDNEKEAVLANETAVKLMSATYQEYLTEFKLGKRGKSELLAQQHKLEQQQLLLKESKNLLSEKAITAPVSGHLGKIKVKVGQSISAGQPITNIINSRFYRVEFLLPERYINHVKPGLNVFISPIKSGHKQYDGTIIAVDNTVNSFSHSIKAVAQIITPGSGVPVGSLADVTIYMQHNNNVLAIPKGLIRKENVYNSEYVFLVKHNKAIKTKLKLGNKFNGYVKVLAGLKRGDLVVSNSKEPLYDRATVVVMARSNKPGKKSRKK